MTNVVMMAIMRMEVADAQADVSVALLKKEWGGGKDYEDDHKVCVARLAALTAAADALERERWHPIAEMREDDGPCIVFDMVNGGALHFLSMWEPDFEEISKGLPHFRRFCFTDVEGESLDKEVQG